MNAYIDSKQGLIVDDKNNSDKIQSLAHQEISYIVEISDSLHKKITTNISLLKKLVNRGTTKQSWAIDAINKKLKTTTLLHSQALSKAHFLRISIPKDINRKIEGLVEAIRQSRASSYSKKKWILEALHEMLEEDQEKITSLTHEPSMELDKDEKVAVSKNLLIQLIDQTKSNSSVHR